MELGAQLYTVRQYTQTPEGIEDTLVKVARMGYRYVQCSAMGPIEPERLRDALLANGLTCVLTHTDPERILSDTDRVIAEHQIYGCPRVGMGMMPPRYRGSLEGLRALIRDARPAARRIQDAGLSFHYHNHHLELIREGKETLLDILLAEFPEMYLTLCTYWIQAGGGDPIQWTQKTRGRVQVMHAKDMAYGWTEAGGETIMTPVFEGNMNYDGILKAAREAGIDYALVEQDTCQCDPMEALEISYRNLRAWGL